METYSSINIIAVEIHISIILLNIPNSYLVKISLENPFHYTINNLSISLLMIKNLLSKVARTLQEL